MTPQYSSVATFPADPRFIEAVGRIRAEFIEMPGLKLTLLQAARLCAMDLTTCAAVLSSLVEARFLIVTRDAYMRA